VREGEDKSIKIHAEVLPGNLVNVIAVALHDEFINIGLGKRRTRDLA
jgi:hypothetical protein